MSAEPRLVEVRKNVLKQNDVVARAPAPDPARHHTEPERPL